MTASHSYNPFVDQNDTNDLEMGYSKLPPTPEIEEKKPLTPVEVEQLSQVKDFIDRRTDRQGCVRLGKYTIATFMGLTTVGIVILLCSTNEDTAKAGLGITASGTLGFFCGGTASLISCIRKKLGDSKIQDLPDAQKTILHAAVQTSVDAGATVSNLGQFSGARKAIEEVLIQAETQKPSVKLTV